MPDGHLAPLRTKNSSEAQNGPAQSEQGCSWVRRVLNGSLTRARRLTRVMVALPASVRLETGRGGLPVLLVDGPAATGASAWTHRFEAIYTVVVGSRLSLALQVTNLSDETVGFEEALHTYFDVREIRAAEVTGLEGTAFYDRLAGPEPVPGEPDPVRFASETDRIYLGTRASTMVRDAEAGRSVLISKDGSDATVVWNPWVDKARAMDDFGDDEWKRMVCVEVGNIREATIHLAPGGSHTMMTTFEVSPMTDLEPRSTPS